ncbi:hypothetical protein BIFCAT_01650 [Bifidobacterium catenulatum DSM 16992 = JCM 1194 = LMG 11043]|uniref:Uncharacterized protein n=1 Tax=Bifidobacterium catenulatum DSM 16992 = JCM 1194 = LMG 11043 TaxID=566552 RepID=B6XWJ1_9BIFI|nr:hypothetical protein BIFCAT_01650 [Bifidobacterium catenulatum DSM 16992 = JCM 1194 = LMG 11043]
MNASCTNASCRDFRRIGNPSQADLRRTYQAERICENREALTCALICGGDSRKHNG